MDCANLTDKKDALQALRPLPPALARNLEDWFRVELTYTSNAIEGNTLTRRETAIVIEKGLTVGGKSLVEHLEATNHADALEFVGALAERNHSEVSEKDIVKIHETILRGIDDGNAGRYRDVPVRISGSNVVLPNPVKVPGQMAEFSNWLAGENTLHPVEFAAEAHYRLVTIHPFVDGNGRTARLLMNLLLLMSGYPPAIIRNRDRLAYIESLERAQTGGPKTPYFDLIAKAVDRSLDIYLNAARGEDANPEPDEETLLRIGQLAKAAGKSNSTIRFWTQNGLLEVVGKTEAGYQLYGPDSVKKAKRIVELQEKRMTLEEIRRELRV